MVFISIFYFYSLSLHNWYIYCFENTVFYHNNLSEYAWLFNGGYIQLNFIMNNILKKALIDLIMCLTVSLGKFS